VSISFWNGGYHVITGAEVRYLKAFIDAIYDASQYMCGGTDYKKVEKIPISLSKLEGESK